MISYGVKLRPKASSFSMGAGVTFNLTSGLEYDVHITVDKCCVVNNVQPRATHLYLGIFSSCTILVKDSNFTYANRITVTQWS